MFKTDISSIIKSQEILNFPYISSPDTEYQKRNRNHWRKILGTFDLIKENTAVNRTKPERKPIRKKKTIHKTGEAKFVKKKAPQRRIILSATLTNVINEKDCSQANLKESEIVWSSSNEDSDSCLGNAILNKTTDISRRRGSHNETEINWSSSDESENEENSYLNKKSDISRCRYLKRKLYESEINWSSSNESENEGNSTQKNGLSAVKKKDNSECELDLFVREIEKDLRRTKNIKQKLTAIKGGYVDSFRRAVNKAKADTGFLEYEQRAEIICGSKGVIIEKKVSYGSYLANIQLEVGSNYNIFLGKNMQTSNDGSVVICFLDDSQCYTVNDKNVYIQPNKVIRT